MRRRFCVPMMALCLLLTGCGGGKGGQDAAQAAREPFQKMSGCTMTADVSCGAGTDEESSFTMKCTYVPDGACTVEVLAPETVAGVRAAVDGEDLTLTYDGDRCLNAGTLSGEQVSPVACLPRLMDALRRGWLLEEGQEKRGDTPCLRLSFDQTGAKSKIVSSVWLRREDGIPLYGEISVDNEIILKAEFTNFQFGDILQN